MRETERTKALGDWGEKKALELLNRPGSGFTNAKDVNEETYNHPFGDIAIDRNGERFLLGVNHLSRRPWGLIETAANEG